jgi:hypothetical protein
MKKLLLSVFLLISCFTNTTNVFCMEDTERFTVNNHWIFDHKKQETYRITGVTTNSCDGTTVYTIYGVSLNDGKEYFGHFYLIRNLEDIVIPDFGRLAEEKSFYILSTDDQEETEDSDREPYISEPIQFSSPSPPPVTVQPNTDDPTWKPDTHKAKKPIPQKKRRRRKGAGRTYGNSLECPYCGEKIKGAPSALQRHITNKHVCPHDGCSVISQAGTSIVEHYRFAHRQKIIKCPYCTFTHFNPSVINQHLRRKHRKTLHTSTP